MSPKTTIEKLASSSPDVTIFKITGTLGFHEKKVLERVFDECNRRGLGRVLFDISELESLGGGCARIIREESTRGRIAIGLIGANKTVLKFLKKENAPRIVLAGTVEEGIPAVMAKVLAFEATPEPGLDSDEALLSNESLDEILKLGDGPAEDEDVDEDAAEETAPHAEATPAASKAAPEPGSGPVPTQEPGPGQAPESEPKPELKSEPKPGPGQAPKPKTEFRAGATTVAGDAPSIAPKSDERAPADEPALPAAGDDARQLQKRIVQYNTLLSINSDFNRFEDRKSLLDAFLLTTIAQVGVESAVFLEHNRGYFVPVAMKGIEEGELRGFAVSGAQLKLERWAGSVDVHAVEKSPFGDEVKAPLLALGCTHVLPFIVHGDVRGIVLMGRPIRHGLDSNSLEFLKILVHQAAIAYENMSRLEAENERTLGVVQTLIALIEENTLARGNTNLISNHVHAVATRMHYPAEHMRDLMYGTVLRDIGMIKVSDLIVRSPRELMPEEWEIIKRHPSEGAAMLKNMKFSEHATGIVLHHHERFNGEGYPRGVQGQDIPLGARIVSVVESYAAMLQERPTRPALTREEALNTLKENWGMRYDPEVVRAFVEAVEEEIRGGETGKERRFALFSV
jgi:hypothetical protein